MDVASLATGPTSADNPKGQAIPPAEAGKAGRLVHLDALRGLAAVLVMVQHSMTIIAEHPAAPQWYRAFVNLVNTTYFSPGRAGVVAFFLISGYVVPFSLKQPHALQTFAISRFFRLYPAYWVSLALMAFLMPALGIEHHPLKQLLANVTMIQFALRQQDVIGAYWTLFIELVFYVCCATWFVFGVLRSARFLAATSVGLLLLALAAAAVRYSHPHASVPVGYINFLAAMHIGTLARLATLEGDILARRLLPWTIACALIATIGVSYLAYSKVPDVDPWISGITGLYAGYALFFYCILRKAFVSRVTIFLGGISYSFYLLHGLTLRIGRWIGYDLPWWKGAIVILACVLLIAMPLATLVFRFIERPAVRVGHRLMTRLRQPTRAARAISPAE